MQGTVEVWLKRNKIDFNEPVPLTDDEDEATLAAIDRGIKDADEGRTVAHRRSSEDDSGSGFRYSNHASGDSGFRRAILVRYPGANFPGAAERFASSLLNHLDLLRRFPRLGSARLLRPGVRMMVHFPIRIHYRVHDDERLSKFFTFGTGRVGSREDRYNACLQLSFIDWAVVALYFLFNLAIGLYYKSRAGKSMDEFFLSGRNIPWWLAGTSMVATTFAADTPLAVTGMVAKGGIAGNWLWWNIAASGLLTVFFYARLWRRSGVMTDIEFSEIRYAGKPAAFLRGFRALYLAIPINCIILGWVNKAMVDILTLILGVTKLQALMIVLGMIAITSFDFDALGAVGRAGHRRVSVRRSRWAW